MQEPVRRSGGPPDVPESSDSAEASAGLAASPPKNLTLLDDTFRRLGGVFGNRSTVPFLVAAFIGVASRNKNKPDFSWWPPVVVLLLAAVGIFAYCFLGAAVSEMKRLFRTAGGPPSILPSNSLPASASGDAWWLLFDRKPTGPFSREELVAAARRGDFAWESLVCRGGTQEWVPLRSFDSGNT